MAPPKTDKALLLETVNAVVKHGSQAEAARQLGVSRTTLMSRLDQANLRGVAPTELPPDPPLKLFGTSTLRNAEGDVILEWEKRKADSVAIEAKIRATVEAMAAPIKGLHKPTKAPKVDTSKLLTQYNIGDAHLGMYAWGQEAEEDFDLETAERDLLGAIDRLVSLAPASETCLIAQLGDFYHIDDSTALTPTGHNQLDMDTRYQKVIDAGIRVERYFIERALERHKKVYVRNVKGNHDPHSSIALDVAMEAYYHAEPRVIIERNPTPFWAFRFHKCIIGLTHGHDPKPPILPKLLAHDYPEWWAACPHKYVYHGHLHHDRALEDIGVKVSCERTLAAKDFWHYQKGYRAGRDMKMLVFDAEYGEIERHIAGLSLVRDEAT